MKKLYVTIGWFALAAGVLHAQNVGIGTATPAIKLDVAGGFATSVTNATSANSLTIPANTSVYRIQPGGGATATMSLTATGPVEGQRLLIINDHATYAATFAGATIAAGGGSGSFAYIGGAWRYFGGFPTPTTAWSLTGNAGTNPATNFVGTTDAQDLSIRAGANGRIRVYTDGRVLVGSSTNMSQRLTVGGHNSTLRLTGTGANESGATMFFGDGANVSLQEDTDNTLRIDATGRTAIMGGNVGIKTANPIQDLDVNGRMNVANGVIQRGGAAITTTSQLGLYSRVVGDGIRFVTDNGFIRFFTDGGTDPIGSTVRMTVEANGNVGIGTASPAARLHVSGGPVAWTPISVNGSGGTVNIPNTASNVIVSSHPTTGTTNLTMTGAPTEGQILTIYNSDADYARFPGATGAYIDSYSGANSYVYLNGNWRLYSSTSGFPMRRFYSPPVNINNNTLLEYTLTEPSISESSFVQVSVWGNWGPGTLNGLTIRNVETFNGGIRVRILNQTGFNLNGFDLQILVVD